MKNFSYVLDVVNMNYLLYNTRLTTDNAVVGRKERGWENEFTSLKQWTELIVCKMYTSLRVSDTRVLVKTFTRNMKGVIQVVPNKMYPQHLFNDSSIKTKMHW